MTFIKREESVLVALALFLLAGVILLNVFTAPSSNSDNETATSVDNSVSTTHMSSCTTYAEEDTKNITSETSQTKSVLININTATVDELMTLNGIGEVKAKAIIDYRETYGPFPTINSLTNVTGIGDKTLDRISDKITVD